MKSLIFIAGLFASLSSFILPTPDDGVIDFYLDSNELVGAEQSICLAVTTDDFENVSFAQIPVQFDKEKLTFSSITNEYFNQSVKVPNQETGTVRYILQDPTLENPLEMPDCAKLFDICFNVENTDLDNTSVSLNDIEDVPPPFFLSIVNQEGEEVETNINVAKCNANMDSVFFCLDEPIFVIGEEVCIPLKTTEFTNLQSFQFAIEYDTLELLYKNATNFNGDMNINSGAFNDPEFGTIRAAWFDQSGFGVTLENCVTIADICFDVLQVPDSSPAIMITDNLPNGIEVTDAQNTLIGMGTTCNCVIDNVDELNQVDFSISPNPVRNTLKIDWPRNTKIQYVIIDIKGNEILSSRSASNDRVIDVKSLPQGIYILRVEDSYGNGNYKFIKQ